MAYNSTDLFLNLVTCQLWAGCGSVPCHLLVGVQANGVASIWDVTGLMTERKENMVMHVFTLSFC